MGLSEGLCLSLAIAPLNALAKPGHYAIWVIKAPNPGGYGHHDRIWSDSLTQLSQTWQRMFSLRGLPEVPRVPQVDFPLPPPPPSTASASDQEKTYAGRLMQHLGISLWQWLFDGPIQSSFDQSQGIAIGQRKPLRLRIDIRDPELIALPWEIMQPQLGKQAVSLNQQLLFSRTTSAVDTLPPLRTEQALKILLVLGHDGDAIARSPDSQPSQRRLQLERESNLLSQLLKTAAEVDALNSFTPPISCTVTTLLQPTAAELTDCLDSQDYNVFFYAGHGVPAPDGGLLFLRADATLSGMELAQVLVRCRVKLAVFNACWGAQPDHQNGRAMPRSSLAEVLIHHGVPAVLGMRDSIADREALSFIQVFTRSLAERYPIDEAVAIARQHLLTLYKFNQAAWTLPVLYMHPEFDGELIKPITEGVTEIPDNSPSWISPRTPIAYLRSLTQPTQTWHITGGIIRVGKIEGNDMVLPHSTVSRRHAEIFYRDTVASDAESAFVLRDFSRFGTLVMGPNGWYRVHQQEVPLPSKTRIKFGNVQVEFVVEG
ncbi:MAG: CHAT domain-containing protein [Leptolyngbyaceae cyanobacterium SL_7_1]|nr:CHAT domain-containing protein [Leptolyngbyaceae cyanobacterium SL_7_1]